MAKGRLISMNFWSDGKVEDDFTPEDKYGYLWCLTNPHTNLCGCYEISTKQIAHELGYNTDTVERLLKRLDGAHNVIRYSAPTKELLVLNWYRYNWNASEKLDMSGSEFMRAKKFRTICGIVACAGLFLMLGAAGGSDTGTLDLQEIFWMTVLGLGLFAGGCYLGGYIE